MNWLYIAFLPEQLHGSPDHPGQASDLDGFFHFRPPLRPQKRLEGTEPVSYTHLPYDKGGVLDMLYREAKVDNVEYGETILVQTTCTPKVLGQVNAYVMEQKESE